MLRRVAIAGACVAAALGFGLAATQAQIGLGNLPLGAGAGIGAAWTLVRAASVAGSLSTSTTSPAISTSGTGTNLIVVDIAGSAQNPTVTDSNSASLTQAINTALPGFLYCTTYYLFNPTLSASYTVTQSGGDLASMDIEAWKSAGGPGLALDQTNGNSSGTAVTTLTTGSVTPAANGEMIHTMVGFNTAMTSTPTVSIGVVDQFVSYSSGTPNWGLVDAYYVQGQATAINPSYTFQSSGACAQIVTFKAHS